MSDDSESPEARAKRAQEISQNPEKYKVCECCGSIVVSRSVTCPACHGYRFDSSPFSVAQKAREIAQRRPCAVLPMDLS
jgi:uncharacterized OB-fold protein